MTAQTVSKKNQSLKCSQEVRNIPLERFRLPGDGRKWKQVARSRRSFLLLLATYANADGTFVRAGKNYSPSLKTLLNHVGHGSYYLLTDSLQMLGLLSWTRERHYDRRIYTIHPLEQVQDSQESSLETGPAFNDEDEKQVQDSTEQVQDSQLTGPSISNHPSLPSLPSKERAEEAHPGPALASTSKPKAAGREQKDAESLYEEIKQQALSASNGHARGFYKKTRQATEQLLMDNPNITRDEILAAVRTLVRDMEDFDLRNCGTQIVEMLIPLIRYKIAEREAQSRHKAQEAAQIAAIHAEVAERHKREEAERAEAEAETVAVGSDGKGLFG